MLKKIIFVWLILFSNPAFAYLDPGTGSMLLYFLIAVFATLIYSIKEFFYKVKAFFIGGKVDTSLRNLEGIDILFYSEGGQYWHVFASVIEALEKQEIKCAYYTSDDSDEGLKANNKNLVAKYIGNELSSFILLNHVDVRIVVMTTPQLDVMQLKRSQYVKHYVHLIHAPTDALIYKKFAFDYFDSVMCSGSHQIESIRALEEKRELPKKLLLETGLTYYDVMYRNKDKYLKQETQTTVLIAPTWGSNGMLTKFGYEPIEALLKANYQVILRPHPQIYVSQKALIENIENKLINYENLEIDRQPSGEVSMGRADVMISDISGIIFDFFFIYEKPIVIIEEQIEKGGLEAEDVEKEIWEISMFAQLATLVNSRNIDTIVSVVEDVVETNKMAEVEKIRDESLFNFTKAGETAATQLIGILKGI